MKRSFGQSLRDVRQSKGISQRELAKKVGIDYSYVSKVENDHLPPPAADTIVKICQILGIPPDELLALTGKVPAVFIGTIGSNVAALEFVRSAQSMSLSEEEWKKLTQQLKRLRS